VKVVILVWRLAVGLGRQAIARKQWSPGLSGAWRRGRSRKAIAAETIALECVQLVVWIVPPGGGWRMVDS